MICKVCNTKISGYKKIKRGKICKNCYDALPACIQNSIRNLTSDEICLHRNSSWNRSITRHGFRTITFPLHCQGFYWKKSKSFYSKIFKASGFRSFHENTKIRNSVSGICVCTLFFMESHMNFPRWRRKALFLIPLTAHLRHLTQRS